jgi:hypothetical protein
MRAWASAASRSSVPDALEMTAVRHTRGPFWRMVAVQFVEGPGELALTVTDQEPDGDGLLIERGHEVAGLLGDPRLWDGGDAG